MSMNSSQTRCQFSLGSQRAGTCALCQMRKHRPTQRFYKEYSGTLSISSPRSSRKRLKGATNSAQPISKALLRNDPLEVTPLAEGLLCTRRFACTTHHTGMFPYQPGEAQYALSTDEKLRLRDGRNLLKVTQPFCCTVCWIQMGTIPEA